MIPHRETTGNADDLIQVEAMLSTVVRASAGTTGGRDSGCDPINTAEWNCVVEAAPAGIPPRIGPYWSPPLGLLDFRLGLGRRLGMQHVFHRRCRYFVR